MACGFQRKDTFQFAYFWEEVPFSRFAFKREENQNSPPSVLPNKAVVVKKYGGENLSALQKKDEIKRELIRQEALELS